MEQRNQPDLLSWFDGDQKRLEDFRRRLVYWFGKQGCRTREECEDCAQKTLLRAMEILAKKPDIQKIVPEQYIPGVAKYILKERPPSAYKVKSLEAEPISEVLPDGDSTQIEDAILDRLEMEQQLKCLEKCMQQLQPEERELVELYAQSDKHYSKNLVEKYGGSRNALRLRIFHTVRGKLSPCVQACLNSRPSSSR
ncbi:MAG: hypothetical protein ONB44_17670 [candidate division KSB1 bacterium]|nr:hypothetical protein [candidate division KSB1 bacterium]MDZ7303956.1 hypothetical protein [candidate division KSB1 bacterium]MDZ7313698.1 hypothetical protein [candidate division KSB1 bacterium]